MYVGIARSSCDGEVKFLSYFWAITSSLEGALWLFSNAVITERWVFLHFW